VPSWTRVNSPEVREFPAFAHAAIAGDQVHVSGMLGIDDRFEAIVPGGVGPETTQALRHAEAILRACDASLADVVRVEFDLIAHKP
jgi:2-iminobutanoate/2-iminopropanoate deaminase